MPRSTGWLQLARTDTFPEPVHLDGEPKQRKYSILLPFAKGAALRIPFSSCTCFYRTQPLMKRVCVAENFHSSLLLKCSLSPETSPPGSAAANRGNPQLSRQTQLHSVVIHGCKLSIIS